MLFEIAVQQRTKAHSWILHLVLLEFHVLHDVSFFVVVVASSASCESYISTLKLTSDLVGGKTAFESLEAALDQVPIRKQMFG